MLNPSMMTNNLDIGEVVYRSEANSFGNHKIEDLWYWNITWKRPSETNLFRFEDENLKASSYSYSFRLFSCDYGLNTLKQ